jgi:SAM-dependent methyltransferase
MSESTPAADFQYVGTELELFAQAVNWKTYFGKRLRRYIAGDVLEVGAGIGGTSRFLCHPGVRSWSCLEPDPALAGRLGEELRTHPLPVSGDVRAGTTADLPAGSAFDTLCYIDVIEHIEDDRAEVARAVSLLRPGGRVVVLVPAHPKLYTPFDAALGHFRRYTTTMLREINPPRAELEAAFYLDSVGLLASLGNKLVLKQSKPTPRQIKTWDRLMVPFSRLLDPLTGYRLGKSAIGVWRRPV